MAPELPPVPATPETGPLLGSGPVMVPPPMTNGPQGFFVIGSDDKPTDDRVVALTISVHADIKAADREFSASLGLHEALVVRQYLDASCGGCTMRLTGSWPPGLVRHRKLTQGKLRDEVMRLASKVVPRKDAPPLDCFGAFFPGNANEKLAKVHRVMGEQFKAWERVQAQAMDRLKANPPVGLTGMHPEVAKSLASEFITEKEIMEVAQMVDPSNGALSEMVLPEVSLSPAPLGAGTPLGKPIEEIIAQAEAEAADPAADRVHDAFARLKAAGFSDAAAVAASGLLENNTTVANIPEEAIISAIGSKAKLGAAKIALRG